MLNNQKMKINLIAKKALVGASTRGLGFASAYALAECGASVFLLGRDEDKLKAAMEKLPRIDPGQQHNYLVADFSDFSSFRKVVSDFFCDHHIDILVNNTNGPQAMNAMDADIEAYGNAFDLLFKTVVETTRLALPHMIKNRMGRIINISSTSVAEPISNLVLSNAIRAATAAWAKTLSTEVGGYNITVNNILTGNFNTERIEQLISEQSRTSGVSKEDIRMARTDKIPLRRFGKPEEFGNLVAFLSSDLAAYITGAAIPIDGGLLRSQ